MDDASLDALSGMMETVLSEVNTSMPGVIVTYDPATNMATVRGLIPKRLANGEVVPCPQVVMVPISWPAGSGGHMTFPLSPGDGVNLHFAQRSLENWLNGSNEAPTKPHQFDLSDATATPGTQVSGISADPDAARLTFKGSTIRAGDGFIELTVGGQTLRLDSGGLKHNGKNIGDTHRHNGVQTGPGNTGVPI